MEKINFCECCGQSIGRSKLYCESQVPRSYSNKNIPELLKKVQKDKISNSKDSYKFNLRIEMYKKTKIRSIIVIEKTKANGYKGQENRDALNLLVCQGYYIKKIVKTKNNRKLDSFIRENTTPCRYSNLNFIQNKLQYCLKPNDTFQKIKEVRK